MLEKIIELLCYYRERCTNCHDDLVTRTYVIDTIDYVVCESEQRCIFCNSLQDYYSYGSSQRNEWIYYAEQESPWLSKILKFLVRIIK